MAQTIKMLNWNIQNFGMQKAGFSDILSAVAEVVVNLQVDLFVIMELNTKSPVDAVTISTAMCDFLNYFAKKNNQGDFYKVCVLSPNTGVEFYGFIVRDTSVIQPLPLIIPNPLPVSVGGAAESTPWNHVTFGQVAFNGSIQIINGFPLVTPDLPKVNLGRAGLRSPVPVWPGNRKPAFGLFYVPNANACNRLFGVLACHYIPNATLALQQINVLPYFSVLSSIGQGSVASPQLNIKFATTAAASYEVQCGVVTGDFNINYGDIGQTTYYNLLRLNYPPPSIGYAIQNTNQNTHTVDYAHFSLRVYHTTDQLATSNYDNFFIRAYAGAANPATAANTQVFNLAEAIRLRKLSLSVCVNHYAELDKKGFSSGLYNSYATDFVSQLTNPTTIMNTKAALVGSRLISDHWPVYSELNL